jgi:L-ascorbate metabolism protein UlaG (beta-lactamase superfamily)
MHRPNRPFALLAGSTLLLAAMSALQAHTDELLARYLANAGVMIRHGNVTVLFDPLFRNGYGRYERVPADVERALFAGDPPWNDIDAVFISHHHGDHFDPGVMLDFLAAREEIELYAPAQAIDAIKARGADETVVSRMTSVALAYGDPPLSFDEDGLRIDAVRVPHSGWPERMTDVENIAWRVTLSGAATVIHLGDADTRVAHFEQHSEHWSSPVTDLAMPPYWYFLSAGGREILDDELKPRHAIGVHVPADVPDEASRRPPEFDGYDLFTVPGEVRTIDLGAEH